MAVRSAAGGLSPDELEQIRDALAAGRRPKVVFTQAAGQIAGQQGQVVGLTDPQDSDEWVVVRFGRDELPFSPADLAVAPKATPGHRAAKAVQAAKAPELAPGPPLLPPEQPAPPPVSTPTTAVPTPREEKRPATGSGAAGRKAGRGKPAAALTVTLSYADGEWMVAAQQGAKVLAKPYLIKPSEALKMVGMLDVPGVQAAVEEIVSAARAEAEAAAERLRAELAEVEARLAELRDAT
ncbi:hypothetical protein HC028_14245 [Planosporangium flavigriseum]|nr:hypothetical protein [Planosporangium flavigriseum]NJC65650.1 hypothetical protein [Planosporangium flavigriseum]